MRHSSNNKHDKQKTDLELNCISPEHPQHGDRRLVALAVKDENEAKSNE